MTERDGSLPGRVCCLFRMTECGTGVPFYPSAEECSARPVSLVRREMGRTAYSAADESTLSQSPADCKSSARANSLTRSTLTSGAPSRRQRQLERYKNGAVSELLYAICTHLYAIIGRGDSMSASINWSTTHSKDACILCAHLAPAKLAQHLPSYWLLFTSSVSFDTVHHPQNRIDQDRLAGGAPGRRCRRRAAGAMALALTGGPKRLP